MSDVRVRKLQEFIKQEVSGMLMRGLKDPRIGFVTVTEVEVTGDLRQATIYVSLFGKDEEKKASLQLCVMQPAIFAANWAKYCICAIHRKFSSTPILH